MTSQFVYFIPASQTQEIGSLTATLDVASSSPEPSTRAMMILGFMGGGFLAYRRKQNGPALRLA